MDTWAAADYSQDEPLDFLRDPVKLSRTPVLTDKPYPGFHYHQTELKTSEKTQNALLAAGLPSSGELSHVQRAGETQERGRPLQVGGGQFQHQQTELNRAALPWAAHSPSKPKSLSGGLNWARSRTPCRGSQQHIAAQGCDLGAACGGRKLTRNPYSKDRVGGVWGSGVRSPLTVGVQLRVIVGHVP